MVKFTFPLPSKRFEQGRHLNSLTRKTITLLNWYKIGLKTLHQPKDPWKVPWRLLLNLCILFPPSNNWLLKCIFLDVSFVLNIFIVLGLGSYGEPGLWDHTLAGPHPSSSLNSEDLGKQLSAISHNLSCVCSTGTTEVTTSQCLTESSVR